jgi:hypothetical protein
MASAAVRRTSGAGRRLSVIVSKQSALQYQFRPGGNRASNMLFNAGNGIGPAKSMSGLLKARIGSKTSSALPGSPV